MSSSPDASANPADVLECWGVRLDPVRQTTAVAGRPVELTPVEFRLLECLLRRPGETLPRAQLLEAVTQGEAIVLERTVDVHICSLRRKLGVPDLIETVRRQGYRFRVRS